MALPGNELKKCPESSGTELSDFDDCEEGTWNESQIMADYDAEVQKLSIEKVNVWLKKRCADDILEVEDVVNFDEKAIAIRIDCSPDGIVSTVTTVESQSVPPQNVGQRKHPPTEINSKFSGFDATTLVNGWGKPEVEARKQFEEQTKHPTKGKVGNSDDRHAVILEAAKNAKPNQNIGTNKKLDYIADVGDGEINCDLHRKNEMSKDSAKEILKKSIAAFWAAVPENYK